MRVPCRNGGRCGGESIIGSTDYLQMCRSPVRINETPKARNQLHDMRSLSALVPMQSALSTVRLTWQSGTTDYQRRHLYATGQAQAVQCRAQSEV